MHSHLRLCTVSAGASLFGHYLNRQGLGSCVMCLLFQNFFAVCLNCNETGIVLNFVLMNYND